MSDRMVKVNQLVRQALGQIINEELEFPKDTILTIVDIKVSADLSQAKVFLSIIPSDKEREVMKLLIKSAKHLQHCLNDQIILRRVPKLRFFVDKSQDRVEDIEHLLDNLDIHD